MRFASAKSLRCIASMNWATRSRTLGVRVMDVRFLSIGFVTTLRILSVADSAKTENPKNKILPSFEKIRDEVTSQLDSAVAIDIGLDVFGCAL